MSIRRHLVAIVATLTIGAMFSAPAFAGAPAAPPEGGSQHLPEHQIAELGPYTFEDGGAIPNLRVSYVTHGELNEAEDNVVLALHWFAGDHHNPDFLIGPGLALDPDKYFIIAPDAIGNSNLRPDVTTGPTNSGLKMRFPQYSMRDSAAIDVKLVKEYLGFDKIFAVVGLSVGAMKTYQIAVDYPDFAEAIIPMGGTPETSGKTRAFSLNRMDVIALDPGWYNGRYDVNPSIGLKTSMANANLQFLGHDWWDENIQTQAQYDAYMASLDAWTKIQDARDVYYQYHHIAWFKLGDTPGFDGNLDAALRSIKAKTLIIHSIHDNFYLRHEGGYPAQVIPGAKLLEIDSPFAGHVACCGWDPEATDLINQEISAFLESLQSP